MPSLTGRLALSETNAAQLEAERSLEIARRLREARRQIAVLMAQAAQRRAQQRLKP